MRQSPAAEAGDADLATAKMVRFAGERSATSAVTYDAPYALADNVAVGKQIELRFDLGQYETTERAAWADYRVRWEGGAVTRLEPPGPRRPSTVAGPDFCRTGHRCARRGFREDIYIHPSAFFHPAATATSPEHSTRRRSPHGL
jgi:hypothetical protein